MQYNKIFYYNFADDTQIYISVSTNVYDPIDSLNKCIDQINDKMCKKKSIN